MKYEINAQADGKSADIYINDVIGDWIDDYFGFGVTSKQFIKDVQDVPESIKALRLHMNCPGGDVVAANHIANTIRDQQAHKGRTVECLIEGAAFSAATIITSACNPTKIADNGLMMTHNPWTVELGDAKELRKTADVLDKYRDTIVAAYRWKSPLSEQELIALMDAETWMDADDALKNGFADEKIAGVNAFALIDTKYMAKLPKIPEQYQERVQAMLKPASVAKEERTDPAPTPPTPQPAALTPEEIRAAAEARATEVVSLCTRAGVADAAANFLEKGLSVDDVKGKLKDADKIRARCTAAKLPDRANAYIKAGMSIGEVANELFDVLLTRQGDEIDNKLSPDGERGTKDKPKTATTAEIYEMRRKKK